MGTDDDPLIDPGHPSVAAARGLHGVTEEIRRVLDDVLGARISVGLFGDDRMLRWDDASWRDPEELEALIRVRRPGMVVMVGSGEDEVWTRTAFVITAQRILSAP